MQITVNNYAANSQVGFEGIKVVAKETSQGPEDVEKQGQQEQEAASVTISREGREKLQQSLNANPAENPVQGAFVDGESDVPGGEAASAKDRAGQNGIAEVQEPEPEEEDPYRAALEEVKDTFVSIMASSEQKPKKEDIEEMQRALEDMRRLKQFQADAERQKEKEIREAKTQSGKWRSEVDKDNADLLIMLESFEESQKKQDEMEAKKETKQEAENESVVLQEQEQEPKKMGDVLKDSASRMTGTVIDKEELKDQSIQNVDNMGMYKLQNAEEEFWSFMQEYDNLSRAFVEEGLTEEEKSALVERYVVKAKGDRFGPGGYQEVQENRARGLALRQFARDLRREDRSVRIMPGMQKIKGEMETAGSDALINSEAQEQLDKAASDVQQRVQDKLEERNDITGKDTEAVEEAKEEEVKEALQEEKAEEKAEEKSEEEKAEEIREAGENAAAVTTIR